MNKVLNKFAVIAALFSLSTVVQSDDGIGIGVGAQVSTLGMGIELGKSLSDNFSVRLGLNNYSDNETQTIDNIDYRTDLDLQSTILMFDWYPFAGTFHLTAGYLNSSNDISAMATPDGLVTIGDKTVNVTAGDLMLDAGIALGSGPYVGLGWGNVPASGFGFVFEVGVVQMGTPDVSLTVTDNTGTLGINQNDINKEIANMQTDLDEFDMYPVIALGISYGF